MTFADNEEDPEFLVTKGMLVFPGIECNDASVWNQSLERWSKLTTGSIILLEAVGSIQSSMLLWTLVVVVISTATPVSWPHLEPPVEVHQSSY